MNKISLKYIISIMLLSLLGFGSLYSQMLPPVKLTARPVDANKILLEWEKPTYQVDFFNIYRSVHDTVSFAYLSVVTGDKNNYIDHNLQIGVNYTYYVVALQGENVSSYEDQLVTTQAISGTGRLQINSVPKNNAKVDEEYFTQIKAFSNEKNAVLRYSLSSAPEGMRIDAITGLLTWKPEKSGRYDVKINVKNINDINHIEFGSPIPEINYKFSLQVASQTGSLHGTVKSTITAPLENTIVKIFEIDNDEFTYETITNDNGNFYFDNISAGNYFVYVRGRAGFESKWYPDTKDFSEAQTVICYQDRVRTINFILNTEISENPNSQVNDKISGIVKDTNGIPVNNASVLFYDASRFVNIGLENPNIEDIIDQKNVNYVNSVGTNSKGEYLASLQRGKYYFVVCRADGFNYMFYSNQTNLLYANKIYVNNDRGGVDFIMIPSNKTSNQLKGKVLAQDTEEGIESRIIITKKQEERGGSGLKVPFRGTPSDIYITFKTDVLGNFEIENLDTTMYWIQAIPLVAYLPTYYNSANNTTFNWYDADSVYTFGAISNVKLYSAPVINDGVGTITGKVIPPIGFEESLRGIVVYAKLYDNYKNVVAYAVTDSLGNYLIKGLRSGIYNLFVDFLGFKTLSEISVELNYENSFVVKNANITLDVYKTPNIPIDVPDPFVPTGYYINQNYPNPFNPSTTIEYKLDRESYVELRVCDLLGREVTKLVESNQQAGTHKVRFNARNLSSGIYFATIKVQNGNKVVYLKQIKMLLTK